MAAPRAEALPPFLVADDEDRELAIMQRAILAALVTPVAGSPARTSTPKSRP